MTNADWIRHTTDDTFETEVVERSRQGLVVLDFWAEWCGPCRALAPVLEKLALEYAGRFTLVKANTDETPEAAGKYSVASIPTVLGIMDGEIVDAFEGALPERQIRHWLDKILTGAELRDAQKIQELDPAAAEKKLRELAAAHPRNRDVATSLAGLLLKQHRWDECKQMLDALEQDAPLEPDAAKLKSTLFLHEKADMDVEAVRQAAMSEPTNWASQLKLAEALVGHQEYVEAFEICLNLVARDRKQTGEQARALMVEVFRALPDDSPLTSEYRRKLSSALY